MKTTEKEMDMLNGGIAGKLILFSLPLAFSSILQQLFNSADVAVVGRFAGDQALAAVGSCVALVGIFVNLIVGLSVGPNAVLASLIGQKKRERIPGMLHTVLTFGAALGVFLMLLGMLTARLVLEASGTPESVMAEALLYIRIYFLSIPFMLIYNFGSATLRSFGDTRRPMYYLLASGIVNVILNLVLVISFRLGVSGVAIATVISNILSASLVIHCLHHRRDEFQFRFHDMRIKWTDLKKILIIGIPAGIQGAIFSISNVFIQSGINSFGEDAIAGSSLALNFEYFTYDIANAFAQAAVTFTTGFALSRYSFKGRNFWYIMLILAFILPIPLLTIPRIMVFTEIESIVGFKVIGTIIPQFLMSLLGQGTYSTMLILIAFNFFNMIPKSLDEAAMIDGAGSFRVFYHIAVRLSISTILVVFLFSFVFNWNETYTTNTMLGDALTLVTAKLALFDNGSTGATGNVVNEANRMAATLISIAPLLALYMGVQKQFIQGIENTGITGE